MRRGSAVLLISIWGLLASASLAWAVGELTQKPGASGCFRRLGTTNICQLATGFNEGTAVAISPDGKNVYVGSTETGNGSVEIFARDPATGALTQKPGKGGCLSQNGGECEPAADFELPRGIAFSPNGESAYVASEGSQHGGLIVFDRNQAGALTVKPGAEGCFDDAGREGCTKVSLLEGATAVAVSPDGKSVYMTTGPRASALMVFDRDPDGKLTPKNGKAGCFTPGATPTCESARGFDQPVAVAISPDGKSVYVGSRRAHAISVFDRAQDGTLTQKPGVEGCIALAATNGCTATPGLRGVARPAGILVSPDGGEVLVVSTDDVGEGLVGGVSIFRRNEAGSLNQKDGPSGCITKDGSGGECESSPEAVFPEAIAMSQDGQSLYVSGGPGAEPGLGIFDRQADGSWAQKPGLAGCVTKDGSGGSCQVGTGLGSPLQIAVSPDGGSVYTAASAGVAIFDRALPVVTPPPDTAPPTVSGFRLAPRRIKSDRTAGASQFRFVLSEPAGIAIEVQRVRPGRRVGKKCVPSTRRRVHRPRCTLLRRVKTLTRAGLAAGANSIAFHTRVGKRVLPVGSYRATIVATDAAGNRSSPFTTAFKVVPRVRR